MERTYSAMFLYNRPKQSINRNKNRDYVLSYKFVKFAVEKMETWGLKSYYHDHNAKPGSNIFDELFTTVDASRFIVVLCTRGFLKDAWGKYTSHATFAKLLDQNDSERFIAIHIDLPDKEIPDAFNTTNGLSFSANWQNEHEEWEKFKNIFGNHQHLQIPHVGVQEIGGIETDGEPNQPSEINSILQSVNQNTTNSQNAANNQNTTQTDVGLTSSVATPPSTVTSFAGTTMQTRGNREPPYGAAPSTHSQNSSVTKLKEIVGRDTDDENDLLSSLHINDVEFDNSGQSDFTENQVSTDSLKTETEKSQVCSQQPDHTERSVCPNSNSQHDCGNGQGLDLQSVLNDHQDTNGFHTESIGINRVNDCSALLPNNNSDGYGSMD